MENNMILDSETTGTVKPFAYDIGYTIVNEVGEVIEPIIRKSVLSMLRS